MTKSSKPTQSIIVPEGGTTRAFTMHAALLWDVMTRQAGTLSKAAQEGCQNSVDAGATSVKMTLTKNRLIIEDDGKGFVDDREIENFFETFGHPHEEGDAVFGRFRMGRGQLLATGVCQYISNNYRMYCDLRYQKGSKNEGLNYQLYRLDQPHKGCRIEIDLYDELIPSKIDEIEREIARNMKYLQIPLELNGTVVNKLPQDCKWDFQDDAAYYSLRDVGSLSVYNLGVFVKDYPASSYGTGGTVVSKVPLDVNFARNDVVSACKVFKKISAKVRSTSVDKSEKKTTKLNDNEWESLANSVRVGEKPLADVMDLKLLRNSSGAMFSLADLGGKLNRANDRVAAAKARDMVADRILQRGIALVFDEEVLSKFGYGSLKEFKADIAKKAGKEAKCIHDWKVRNPLLILEQALKNAKILETKDFGKYVKADYEEVPIKDLSPAEKFALKVFSRGCYNLGWEISRIYQLGCDLGEEPQYPWQRRDRERDLAWPAVKMPRRALVN
jgi:Histidine kinase-, DNA gyrase B-, and HSP90-like ATPase